MYAENVKKNAFFFHMAYFCRARDDSHEITRDMLKCNTKHTTIVWTHLVVFAVGSLLQLALVTTSPRLP